MSETLLPGLLNELRTAAARSSTITTLSNGKPSWIASVAVEGVWLETAASKAEGSGPQLVPAWMLNTAWHHPHDRVARQLLSAPRRGVVKRSSAVCALLAQFPWVEVVSWRPIWLRLKGQPSSSPG